MEWSKQGYDCERGGRFLRQAQDRLFDSTFRKCAKGSLRMTVIGNGTCASAEFETLAMIEIRAELYV